MIPDVSQSPLTPSSSNSTLGLMAQQSVSVRYDNVYTNLSSSESQFLIPASVDETPVTVRDLLKSLNDYVTIVLSDHATDEEKRDAVESIKQCVEDYYLLDIVSEVAKAAVQMFMHIFYTTAAVPFESPFFMLRKIILELVIRFVPSDGYRCHSRFLEDLMSRQLLTEYEVNAVLMIKYLNDVIRHQRPMNINSLLVLVNDMRQNIDVIIDTVRSDVEHLMFIKRTFSASQLQDSEYMQTAMSNLYFENHVKMLKAPPLTLLPLAKNSVKLVLEFTNIVTSTLHVLRERMIPFMPNIIQSFGNFISLEIDMSNDKVQPENAAIFHEAQLRMLAFMALQLKKQDYLGLPTYVTAVMTYKRQIVNCIRMLMRNLSPLSLNHRKDLLMLTKQLFNTDIRRELLDVVPDLCYEEHIIGPPCLMLPQIRSELCCVNFDTIHNVRTMLDWTTFQHVFVTVLKSAMDYSLTPSVQAVNWKIVLNILDACRKAEDAVYPQLTVGFNYDSARLMYENAFFAACQKLHTIVNESGRCAVHEVSNQNLKSKDGKKKFPVELYTEGQSSDEDSDVESLGSEYERKAHVMNEILPTVEINSDQEDVVDELFNLTDCIFDDNGRFIVDGQVVFETMGVPSTHYPMRLPKRYRRKPEGKKYAINFQHGPGLESVSESDDDNDERKTYYEVQKAFYRQHPNAFDPHAPSRVKIEGDFIPDAQITEFDDKINEFALDCFHRGDLRMKLRQFEKKAQGRKPIKILPLTKVESNFQYLLYGYEDLFPRNGVFDSESGSVQMQPEKFPYSVPDMKLILRHLSTSLKLLMNNCHPTDNLKSGEPWPAIVTAYSDLMRDFILSLDLFTIVSVGKSSGFCYQTMIGPEEKEYIENFISIFHSIHPNVFERIFRQHLPLFFENSLRNSCIANMFISVITSSPLQSSTAFVLVDFVMNNLHYATELDEDDTYRYFVYQRVLKATIQCMSALTAQPQPYGFRRKIQEFFYKFAVVCIRRSHNLIDPAAPITSLRTIFRQCGTVVGEALYELFLPLFPSFLQWMSASQNLVTNDHIQDSFIEMCLSLPTRLSSLVAYMPMIADAAVNSFVVSANQMHNSVPVNPQGWRTLDLCLDNYYTGVVMDFLQPAGLARILECLYKYVSYVDSSQMSLVIKMISKLSGLNRGSVVDVQKLAMKSNLDFPSPCFKIHFERSGKQIDNVIIELLKNSVLPQLPQLNDLRFINKSRHEMFDIKPVVPAKESITISIPLHAVVTQCVNIIRAANVAEGHVQKTFSITGRAEAASFLLNLSKSIFLPETDNTDLESILLKMSILNNHILTNAVTVEPTWTYPKRYLRPWRCENVPFRQFHVKVLTGIAYASVNPDFKPLIETYWEDLVDILTTLVHFETGLGSTDCKAHHPISVTPTMDAFVIVDVVRAIIQDSGSPRFLMCAMNVVMRMMQTALAFASDKNIALNVPLFYHLLAEVCELCACAELHVRNSAILVLQHLIEEMPLTFLHASFGRMFDAIVDVLHFGDDDYSLGCVTVAMSAGETLIDRVLACMPEFVGIDGTEEDDEFSVNDESKEEDFKNQQKSRLKSSLTKELKKKIRWHNIPEFILHGLKQKVLELYKTASFPLAEYLCKVILALATVINVDKQETPFSRSEVTEMVAGLIDIFFATNFQHRLIGIKLVKTLIISLQEHLYIDIISIKRLPSYVKVLTFMAQNRDEDVVTGANYATYHLQMSPGGHLPPTSNMIKYDNGISFIERVKSFRGELASLMAVLTVHFAKSVAITKVELLPIPFHLPAVISIPDMINLMFSASIHCALLTTEAQQLASIMAVKHMLLMLNFPQKSTIIQEIIDRIASSKKIYQIHLLAALVTSPQDFSHKQFYQILNHPENLFSMFANIADLTSVEVNFFESFINICYRAKITVDETFLNHVFLFLSQTRIVNALTLGIADFYSPVARFLGTLDVNEEISFIWFTTIDRIQQEAYRTVFRILAAHPGSKDLLGLWFKHDDKVIDLLLHHTIKTQDSFIRIPEKCYLDVDYMMVHLLMQFCHTFPHFFAEVSSFPKLIMRFMWGRHFRANYSIIDHGTDDRDNLKLTEFLTSKATVPEFCSNMLIHTLTVTPYEFHYLICLCSTLPQMYFSDTSKFRNFVDNFLVPRMTLRWRRSLLHFVNKKLGDLFAEPLPTEGEAKNLCEFMQVCLGHLMNYVLYPAFSYAFDRFIASMVLEGAYDEVFEVEDNWDKHLGVPEGDDKDVTEDEEDNTPTLDMAKEFCMKSLSLYNEKNYIIRHELAHGIVQFSVLLMQRASGHIHEPGMTVQSNDLQNVMQVAWPATSSSGVFTDKWLRAIGLFLLANVMSAVTIKKDIIMQLFDTVTAMPDGRDNPIIQKTMSVVARHAVRRRDDCFTFFVDRIRAKLLEDGFNMIKVGNTLSILANNYEDYFLARHLLSATILFTINRLNTTKQHVSFPYFHDALKTIVSWERMRLAKSALFKPMGNDSERLARLMMDPAMKPLDAPLLEQVATLLIKLSITSDVDRIRRMTPIFQTALHPRVLGRNIFLKLDKMLTPREYDLNSPQYNAMVSQILQTTKALHHYISTAPISNVYCFAVALQHIPKSVIKTNHAGLMDAMVTLVSKLLEICHEAEPTDRPSVRDFVCAEQRFVSLYDALTDYTYKVSIRFAARSTLDFSDINVLLTMLKTVTALSDDGYKMMLNADVIDIGGRMANIFVPSYNNDSDRYKHDLMITLMETFAEKAELLSLENTRMYLQHVVFKVLTRHENLPAKYQEPVVKFLSKSISSNLDDPKSTADDVCRQHVSIVGAIARHHTQTLFKYSTLLTHYLNAVRALFNKVMPSKPFSTDYAELWLAFYTGLSCNEVELREKFLDIFEKNLPNTLFERLVYLFTEETWAMLPGNTFIAVIVNMLLRCVLKNGGPRSTAANSDDASNPQRVVPDVAPVNVFIEPKYSYRAPIHGVSFKQSEVIDVTKMYPKPAPGGIFVKEDAKYSSKHFEQICANYLFHVTNAKSYLNKNYKDIISAFLRIIHEGDTCLTVFEDLFPAIWKTLTEDERTLLTEVTSQFMIMPIFNTCPAHVVHAVWNAVMRCDPPMPIDLTKIMSSLTGTKFANHALVRFEERMSQSVDFHTPFMEMRRTYALLKEDDQLAASFKQFSLCEDAYRAFALYSVGKLKEASHAIKTAQATIQQVFGFEDRYINDELIALRADFTMLTDLGINILKDRSQWVEVNKAAHDNGDVCLSIEAFFQNWQNRDDWQELMTMSQMTKDTDSPKEMFVSIAMRIIASLVQSSNEVDHIFFADNFEERLRNVIVERIRRLPYYYGPDYIDVLADLAIFTDIFELITVMKELYCIEPSKFNGRIDAPLKNLINTWRLRSCSPSDPPDVASRYYNYRITFLWILNNVIQKIRPDFRNITAHYFHLTPAYNIAETVAFKHKALCALGDYDAARKCLQSFKSSGILNSIDVCNISCKSIRALLKQYRRQPETLTEEEFYKEVLQFINANVVSFGPDSLAQYSITMSYINNAFGNKKQARLDITRALATDVGSRSSLTVPAERFYKTLAVAQYEIFVKSPTKLTASYAFEALLKNLDKNFVKNHRHVARTIWVVKNPIVLSPDWLTVLIPPIPTVVFLPLLENIVIEVVALKRPNMGLIVSFIAQVYPFHVLHQLYRQMDSNVFKTVIEGVCKRTSYATELTRFKKESTLEAPFENNVFQTKPDVLSERDGAQGQLFTLFRQFMVNLRGKDTVDKALLTMLYSYVPADVQAYIDVLDALDNMKEMPYEKVLRTVYETYEDVVAIIRESIYTGKPKSEDCLFKMVKCLDDILPDLKDAPEELFAFQNLTDIPDPPPLSHLFNIFVNFIVELEEYISRVMPKISLAEVAPTLYNFTIARAKIPDFAIQHDAGYGQCFPVIENFAPQIRFVAKNMTAYKELNVRLSNGKVVTYRIKKRRKDNLGNGNLLMTLLNPALKKTFNTMKRGAVFRVQHAIPLRNVTLFEVQSKPVNKLTSKPPHVMTLAEIYCAPQPKQGIPPIHQGKLMAEYFECIYAQLEKLSSDESAMDVDGAPIDRSSAFALGICDFNAKQNNQRVLSWFKNYFGDLSTFAYVRKQIATQLAAISTLRYATQGSKPTMDDIMIDLDYGKVWIQNFDFTGETWPANDRRRLILSPQLNAFLGNTLHGHFELTAVAVAKTLIQKGYDDYARPLIADLPYVRTRELPLFTVVNKVVDAQMQRLQAIANFDALSTDTIKQLIDQSLDPMAVELQSNESYLFM